jgi:hypothetical protein
MVKVRVSSAAPVVWRCTVTLFSSSWATVPENTAYRSAAGSVCAQAAYTSKIAADNRQNTFQVKTAQMKLL